MFHCVSESLTNIKLNLLKNGLEAVLLSMVHRQEILDSESIKDPLNTHPQALRHG